ncbi:MAG TPA: hypothetical protein VME66_16670 [Candidatus Acidoferrales bacterium]|nr:hypothetical protein [Candidatus Acidoferrales bacterium]
MHVEHWINPTLGNELLLDLERQPELIEQHPTQCVSRVACSRGVIDITEQQRDGVKVRLSGDNLSDDPLRIRECAHALGDRRVVTNHAHHQGIRIRKFSIFTPHFDAEDAT